MRCIKRGKQLGFTLIELGILTIVMGVIAVFAIPAYLDLSTNVLVAAKIAKSEEVKAAFAVTLSEETDLTSYPSLTELAANVQGGLVGGPPMGVLVSIDSVGYIVPTFNDVSCVTPNDGSGGAGDIVRCVGEIS